MAVVELELPALPEHVRTARLVVVAVARRAGLADDLIDELRLAVGEACARAVGLHQQHARSESVVLRVSDDVTGLSVSVTDCGPPPGPELAELSDAAFQDTGGSAVEDLVAPDVALAVLDGLVDEVGVAPGPHGRGTVVTMIWPLGLRPPGGGPATAAAPV